MDQILGNQSGNCAKFVRMECITGFINETNVFCKSIRGQITNNHLKTDYKLAVTKCIFIRTYTICIVLRNFRLISFIKHSLTIVFCLYEFDFCSDALAWDQCGRNSWNVRFGFEAYSLFLFLPFSLSFCEWYYDLNLFIR